MKKLLAYKYILAYILKFCTKEFKRYSIRRIIECIEGEPEISQVAVHRDEPDANERIEGMNTEDASIREQTVYFDIRFFVIVPGKNERIRMIINVEAQLKADPGYPLENRVVYYICRHISAEYGTVFTKSHYEKMEKVYSIWICSKPRTEDRNSIECYTL